MLTCREVAATIASDSGSRRSWPHRLRLRLHLLMCRHCRAYARQIKALGAVARRLCDELPEDEVALEKLEAEILRGVDGEDPQQRT